MIKKIMLAGVAFIGCNLCAQANEGFYIGGFGGADFLRTNKLRQHSYNPTNGLNESHSGRVHSKVGYTVGANIGYAFDNGFRTEAEVAYRHNKLNSIKINDRLTHKSIRHRLNSHLSTWTYMGNLLYDFQTECGLKPFIGGGIGYGHRQSHFKAEGHKFKSKSSGFVWQAIAGIAYPICENVDLSLEYRYVRGGRFNANHVGCVGLRYSL